MFDSYPFIAKQSNDFAQHGFEPAGSCNCDGVQTAKYKNGEWQLRHRPKYGTFKFKKNGRTVSEWMDKERAKEFIKENICLDGTVKN